MPLGPIVGFGPGFGLAFFELAVRRAGFLVGRLLAGFGMVRDGTSPAAPRQSTAGGV